MRTWGSALKTSFELFGCAHLPELVDEVGEHAARRLMEQNADVDCGHAVIEQVAILGRNLLEPRTAFGKLMQVKTGVSVGVPQGHYQRLDGRVRAAVCPRGQTGVNYVHARFDCLEQRQVGHAGGEMAVKMDGDLYVFFEGFDQVVGIIRSNEARHVLDAERIRAHVLKLFGTLYPIVEVVNRAAHPGFGE